MVARFHGMFTTWFPLMGPVAWRCWTGIARAKLCLHPKYGRNRYGLKGFLVALRVFFDSISRAAQSGQIASF